MRYEYRTEIISDTKYGSFDKREIDRVLSNYANDGWKLHSILTNELGKNTSSSSFGGISVGTNSTVDEILLVFERLIDDNAEKHSVFEIKTNYYEKLLVTEVQMERSHEILSFAIKVISDSQLKIIQADIIFYDVFDNRYDVLDAFVTLAENKKETKVSEPYVFTLPIKKLANIKRADVIIKKYMDSEGSKEICERVLHPLEACKSKVVAKKEEQKVKFVEPIIEGDKYICPLCNKIQPKNRNLCFSCGVKFI